MGILRQAGASDGDESTATSLPHSGGASGVPAGPSQTGTLPPPPASADGRSNLRRRRDELAEQVTELHWDLGGLAYEMAIRDHFRLDVLVRRAAILQERDGELAEVERLLRMEEDAVAGACPHCIAPHSRGALFCWQCGATLMERSPSSAAREADATTAVMDALLAGDGARGGDLAPGSDA
ncbi:MAG TPA: zinc ribbon domain-containing protein [Solirubrobacteraceae bacterium]|nr:zinc ribbon domain-containing protein [Solirubrobacteraceae bacterium]